MKKVHFFFSSFLLFVLFYDLAIKQVTANTCTKEFMSIVDVDEKGQGRCPKEARNDERNTKKYKLTIKNTSIRQYCENSVD